VPQSADSFAPQAYDPLARKAIAALPQIGLQLTLQSLPVPAQVPHVGLSRVVLAALGHPERLKQRKAVTQNPPRSA